MERCILSKTYKDETNVLDVQDWSSTHDEIKFYRGNNEAIQ
jgi:hypothetical protein